MSNPKVSVCLITYNQEKYIAKALDSILEQKTNFKYEVIAGEDCSTDNTKQIIQDYIDKYPHIIKPAFNEINKQGQYLVDLVLKAKGEYVALLEGDDYWCDVYKLQKQVDFLDKNKDFSYCCHRFYIEYEKENFEMRHKCLEEHFSDEKYKEYREVELHNFASPYISKTLTVMFRKDIFIKNNIQNYSDCMGDIVLFGMLLKNEKAAVLNEHLGVFRLRSSGNFHSTSEENKFTVLTENFLTLNKYYDNKILSIKKRSINEISRLVGMLKEQNPESTEKILKFEEMKKKLQIEMCKD